MAKSKETFGKKEKEKKRLKKRKDKEEKKAERKSNATDGSLESMMVYLDENGNLTDTPPDGTKKVEIDVDAIVLGATKIVEDDITGLRTGKVDFFNDNKGFGFIIEDKTKEKFFVHINNVKQQIKEGDHVEFELKDGFKGVNAVNVSIVKNKPVVKETPPPATEIKPEEDTTE